MNEMKKSRPAVHKVFILNLLYAYGDASKEEIDDMFEILFNPSYYDKYMTNERKRKRRKKW